MRAAFWVGCAALLLSAGSEPEPVRQPRRMFRPVMKVMMSSAIANCAMIGGSLQRPGSLMVQYWYVRYPTANVVANSRLPPEAAELLSAAFRLDAYNFTSRLSALNPPVYTLALFQRRQR